MMVGVQATDSHFSNEEGFLGSRYLMMVGVQATDSHFSPKVSTF